MSASKQTVRAIEAIMSADDNITVEVKQTVLSILKNERTNSPPAGNDELLDEKATRSLLKASHQTLWRMERRKELVPIRIGRSRRYSRHQLEAFISSKRLRLERPEQDVAVA